MIAATCSPALCANALAPTNGCWEWGARFASSSAKCDSSDSRASCSSLTTSMPSFSFRLAITEMMLALPQRSPQPLTQACTCVAPASTASSVLATAMSPSLCTWMPMAQSTASSAFVTPSTIAPGSAPPLVSQSATVEAPAPAAARSVAIAYAGSSA